jgi:uncharacterized short protein YbdD (DUF466 family)
MLREAKRARRTLREIWRWLREVTGDAAYENYLRHCAANAGGPGASPPAKMSRAEFYTDSLRRKYSTINRCC